jgi:hypothetical protein
MKTEIPAEGIMKTNDWGNSKVYRVACSCGADGHDHNVWVESEETGVAVTIYTTVKTNWWSKTRWYHIWTLLTKGYIDAESTVYLTTQQSLNYAETLKSAMEDVESFRKARQNKKERATITKLAEQGDCA